MAIGTLSACVRTQQRKRCEFVIEPHQLGPALIIVALATPVSKLTLVWVYVAVAARAGNRRRGFGRRLLVAGGALGR